MPSIRPYKIIDDKYVSQSKYTIDLDLPTSGILSSLMLMVKAQTVDTGECGCPWIKYLISSISVNQAGQAFLNAAPPEAFQSDAYYKTGKMPRRGYEVMGEEASEIIEEVPILFGDHLNDMEHTIDLATLNDPKLSITYDLAATGPNGKTVWDATTPYYPRFTVIAHLLQGAGIPASKGYQSLRQIESYTPVNSEVHKLELKGARPIKRLYLALDKKHPHFGWIHSASEIRLWGDNEAWVPFLLKIDDWYELMRDIYGLCRMNAHVYYVKGGTHVDSCVDKRVYLNANSLHTSLLHRAHGGSGRIVNINELNTVDGTVSSTVLQSQYDFKGYVPWTTGVIDMEKMLGLEKLDPTLHAPVFLELTHVANAEAIGGPVNIYVSDLVA